MYVGLLVIMTVEIVARGTRYAEMLVAGMVEHMVCVYARQSKQYKTVCMLLLRV